MEEAPIVVDLNVLLAAVLNPYGYTASVLLQLYIVGARLYVPDYIHEEFRRILTRLAQRKSIEAEALIERFNAILKILTEVSVEEYTQYMEEAEGLVNDPKDSPYVALALHLTQRYGNAVILTYNQEDYKVEELEERRVAVRRP
ncbi:MAG: PIN domain-containing protein [Desulfurococcales archaeon]|nr:PIN domain-containing protein [Desulfurococcales archaeon]